MNCKTCQAINNAVLEQLSDFIVVNLRVQCCDCRHKEEKAQLRLNR